MYLHNYPKGEFDVNSNSITNWDGLVAHINRLAETNSLFMKTEKAYKYEISY